MGILNDKEFDEIFKSCEKLTKEGKKPAEVQEIMGIPKIKISHRKNYLKRIMGEK